MVAQDLDEWLRIQIKYAPEDMDQSRLIVLEEVRNKLRDLMSERGVELDG
jgi:hypothetical protein